MLDKQRPDSDAQHDRFKELANELECEDDPAAFDRALKKLAEGKAPKHEPKKRKGKEDQ